MSAHRFCVYEHWRPDTGLCFYVGKGTLKRAKLLSRKENPRYQRVVAKLARGGFKVDVRIIACAISEDAAFKIEIARIAELRAMAVPIVNLTDGGEGASGFARPLHIREKISKTMTGRKIQGRRLSLEHRKAISAGLQGRIVSEGTRTKIREAQKGNPRPELVNRKLSPEGLQRLRDRTFSEEHRRKISEGVRAARKRRRLVQNEKIGQTFAAT